MSNNIVIFGATQTGKTTLLGYLSTAMLRHPQLNEEIFQNLKLIKNLTFKDEFSIGNPANPVNVNKEIILPSFVSLDKDELRKFSGDNESSEGTTKRIHHKQVTICVSERNEAMDSQDENENISCTFIDSPGFRQRLSDKYRGFFEGNIGVAILKLEELVEFCELERKSQIGIAEEIHKIQHEMKKLEMRLFEPIRVWCDYRSPKSLVIVISQIDRSIKHYSNLDDAVDGQIEEINEAIKCIRNHTNKFSRGTYIPISPISINITSEENKKRNSRMSIFFKRKEENIYISPKEKKLPGDGTFISCLKKIMTLNGDVIQRTFSMATVYRPMKTVVNGSAKTCLNIHAIHGTIHNTDKVILGPIIDKSSNQLSFAKCTISSIKADGAKDTSQMLLEGNAGGIIFSSINDQNNHNSYNLSFEPKASDISILKSTILFAGGIQEGDIIELEIIKKNHLLIDNDVDEIYGKILPSIMPFDELIIFWYGKKISVNVIETVFFDDRFKMSVIISKNEMNSVREFVLPCNDDRTLKFEDNLLLAVPREYYSSMPKKDLQGKYTYISCGISCLKNSLEQDFIVAESNGNIDIENIVKGIGIDKESIMPINKNLFKLKIKRGEKNKDIYNIFLNISRNLRHSYSRLVYRQIEGIKISLFKEDAVILDKI